jgi:hypothetical protein
MHAFFLDISCGVSNPDSIRSVDPESGARRAKVQILYVLSVSEVVYRLLSNEKLCKSAEVISYSLLLMEL